MLWAVGWQLGAYKGMEVSQQSMGQEEQGPAGLSLLAQFTDLGAASVCMFYIGH